MIASKPYVDALVQRDINLFKAPATKQATPAAPPSAQLPYGASGVDYSNDDNWYYLPAAIESARDLFIIYPSMVFDPNGPLVVPINDPVMAATVKSWCKFNFIDTLRELGYNIFMPKYKQFNPSVLPITAPTVQQMLDNLPADTLASIKDAFAYYWNNYNSGRDFVLYTHSQGSLVAVPLLSALPAHAKTNLVLWLKMGLGTTSQQIAPTGLNEYIPGTRETNCYVGWDLCTKDERAAAVHKINWGDDGTVIHHHPISLAICTGSGVIPPVPAGYRQILCFWNYNIGTMLNFVVDASDRTVTGINLPMLDLNSAEYMTQAQINADGGVIPLAHRYDMSLFMDTIIKLLTYLPPAPATASQSIKTLTAGGAVDDTHFVASSNSNSVMNKQMPDYTGLPSWFSPEQAMEDPSIIGPEWTILNIDKNGGSGPPFPIGSSITFKPTDDVGLRDMSSSAPPSYTGLTYDDIVEAFNSSGYDAIRLRPIAEEQALGLPIPVSSVIVNAAGDEADVRMNIFWTGFKGSNPDAVLQTLSFTATIIEPHAGDYYVAFNNIKLLKQWGADESGQTATTSNLMYESEMLNVPISVPATLTSAVFTFSPTVYASIVSVMAAKMDATLYNVKQAAPIPIDMLDASAHTFGRTTEDVTLVFGSEQLAGTVEGSIKFNSSARTIEIMCDRLVSLSNPTKIQLVVQS